MPGTYDPATDTWTQKADLPGAARSSAVAFTAAGKGYVGTGYDGIDKLKDLYEYDPAKNIWTKKADFAGSARYDAAHRSQCRNAQCEPSRQRSVRRSQRAHTGATGSRSI
jgi:hypothetical protein